MLMALSNYTKSLDEVNIYRDQHINYLKNLIAENKLLVAGRQTPPTGAVIIAKNISLEEFKTILANDPYTEAGVAGYQIIEFAPAICDEAFKAFVS